MTTVWVLFIASMVSTGDDTFRRELLAVDGVYRSEADCLAKGDEWEAIATPTGFYVASCTPEELHGERDQTD